MCSNVCQVFGIRRAAVAAAAVGIETTGRRRADTAKNACGIVGLHACAHLDGVRCTTQMQMRHAAAAGAGHEFGRALMNVYVYIVSGCVHNEGILLNLSFF